MVNDSCGTKRGCQYNPGEFRQRRPIGVHSKVYGTRNDFQKILFVANISLDKKLEKAA